MTFSLIASADAPASPLEVLVFTIGAEEYGIDIQNVQELRGYDAVTRIANAPAHIKGVVNLRGIIVPILDMRIKFGVGEPVYDQFTVVIILNIGARVLGIVVDSVSDVTTLRADQIQPPPQLGASLDVSYVTGLATLDQRMLILVDIEQLVAESDLGIVAELAA